MSTPPTPDRGASEPTLEECRAELARVEEMLGDEFLILPESANGRYIDGLRKAIARKEAERAAAVPSPTPPAGPSERQDHHGYRWEPCEWDGRSQFAPYGYGPARTVDDDIREGKFRRFNSMDDLIRDLSSPETP